uniref:Protein YIPF n=1 Tax=Oxyrrhis marina TaxID=2969 RepID=A0A7S3UNG0_OXYMA
MAEMQSHLPSGSMDESFSSAAGLAGRQSTLDEPIKDTILRDVRGIAAKLKYVVLPRARVEKGAGLREWDLWGPLILCLMLSIVLAAQTKKADQAGQVFALVFVVVWIGSAVVTANALLLKGKISFFQSVCVLGYCIFPLVIAAILSWVFNLYRIVKIIFVVIGFTWATGASVGFMSDLVPEDRKVLAVYPVWLFYVAIAWLILLT